MSTPRRILVVHNAYQHRGGEDSVVEAEIALLRGHGHEVATYFRHNDDINAMSKPALAMRTLWAADTQAIVGRMIRDFRPDLIHAHNTFPLISPALYWAAARAGVPVVQTLHNFRLLCPQAMLLRDGQVCEDCVGHFPWRGVVRRCYRDSAAQSGVLAGVLGLHRALGTYRDKVTRYIALNDFCRDKFVAGGLPAERIAVKPNFVDVPAPEDDGIARSGGLFVGRLSAEKGIAILAAAMERLPGRILDVIGTGPETPLVTDSPGLRAWGGKTQEEVLHAMGRTAYLVMPSICYENFPRTLVEAFARGLPVIASRLGALAELIEEGRTGLLFAPGSAEDLAERIAWAEAHPAEMARMGRAARAEYEAKYTAAINYRQLMEIYRAAIENSG